MSTRAKLIFKHTMLLFLTGVVFFLIHQVTQYLYFDNKALSVKKAFTALWSQGELYYSFIAVMNYIIKPVLFYIFSWILVKAYDLKMDCKSNQRSNK